MDLEQLQMAAQALRDADAMIVTAGAGMGVDSGLPDFRGAEGFWGAYPALRHAGFGFEEIASPEAFRQNPRLAWGFYGHRLALYRKTVPHDGFQILRRWASGMRNGAYVFTSNVDGHFQQAGFADSRVVECHGSINFLQCLHNCTGSEPFGADHLAPAIDEENCLWIGDLPRCLHCGGIARPNILLFNDIEWQSRWYDMYQERMNVWAARQAGRILVVELGAGNAIPTVRRFGERLGRPLIRINTIDVQGDRPDVIRLQGGALPVLRSLEALVQVGRHGN